MPTQTDTPTGLGSTSEWGLYGSAANKLQAVATNDGDTSLIYAVSGGRTVIDLYTFPFLAGVVTPVTAASLVSVVRRYENGGGGHGYYHYWNSTQVAVNRAAEVAFSYTTITTSLAGGDLALAVVNGQHGLQFNAAGGPSQKAQYWATQLYRSVTFDYNVGSAGEFAHLIGSVAAAIGANLLMRDMPPLSRLIQRLTRTLILPSEYAEALEAWRREPHVCLVGA